MAAATTAALAWRQGPEGIPMFIVPKMPKCKVTVNILRAIDLVAKDRGNTSDPYVKMKVQGYKHKTLHTTKVVPKSLNPYWSAETHTFFARENATLELRVLDKETIGKDGFLGLCELPLFTLPKNQLMTMWIPLKKVKKGMLMIKISVSPVTAEMLGVFGATKFFASVRQARTERPRDFIMILDKSGSMAESDKWKSAKSTTHKMSKMITKVDPDGLTLYVFSNGYQRYAGISDHDKVEAIFKAQTPEGGTDLTGVLNAAFAEHFGSQKRATTILVITDGVPNSQATALAAMTDAAKKMATPTELVITFLQIGSDGSAADFLNSIKTMQLAYPIADVVVAADLKGKHFDEVMDACMMI